MIIRDTLFDQSVAKREREIPSELMRMDDTISHLDSLVMSLTDKMSPILSSAPFDPKESISKIVSCPLANEIGARRTRIEEVCSRIAYILENCEL